MTAFDFRDMLGGAGGEVDPDPALADGVTADDADGLHAHLIAKRPGIDVLVEHLTLAIILNANANNLCAQGLVALIVARVGQKAIAELDAATGPGQRQHLIGEVQAMIDTMRRGEA